MHRVRRIAFSYIVVVTALTTCGMALDPKQPITSHLRRNFTVEDGLPDNVVNAIVQTHNGFLWVGTHGGLARFDGEHFTSIHFHGSASQGQIVHSLATTSDGDLWVGTDAGLERIPSAALDHFDPSLATLYQVGAGTSNEIICLHYSREGVLWVGTSQGLYRMDGDRFVPVIPQDSVSRIEEDSDGHLLIIAGQKFVEWNGARTISHPELQARLGVAAAQIFHVFQDRSRTTWYCTTKGVARQFGGAIKRVKGWASTPTSGSFRAYEDHQGNVWIAHASGLVRASVSGLEPLAPGLHARSIYADRDGNLWAGTNGDGLVLFKDRAIRMFTMADGLPSKVPMTVLVSHSGTLWVGNNCGGLSWFDGQRFHTYSEKDGLLNSCVWALAEDHNHDIWIGTWGGGLFRLHDGQFSQYSKPQGLPNEVVRSIAAARDGSLWIATTDGLSHMQNGGFRNYTTGDGLSSNRTLGVYQDRSGGIWAATNVGLDHLVGDRFVPISTTPELLSVEYGGLAEDAFGDLFALSDTKGIAHIEGGRLVSVYEAIGLLGMVDSKGHDLWFSGRKGIYRIAAASLQQAELDHDSPLDYSSFGRADGLNTAECSVGAPDIAITPDGKLWVATVDGLAMLNLQNLPHSNRKPAIFVEEVTVGRKKELAGQKLVLPPDTHHVELHFDAVDLTSPEKIRLQYRLDSVEGVWLDADSTRTAIYTSIPIGSHSFHVRASNSEGMWDRTGIVYGITQQPFFYQTIWFRIASLCFLLLLLWTFYQLRLQQVQRQFNIDLGARVNERTRIARELHDTLLQNFQGLMLRFQTVDEMLPARPMDAKKALEGALDRADQAISEGRDAITDIRTSTLTGHDLAKSMTELMTQLSEELAAGNGSSVTFRVLVEGVPRTLRPSLQDEVCRIARESLRNAFRHAQARNIETEITYGESLRLRFRDDGKGIDPSVVEHGGRSGHWGLPGMRERAKQIGAQLEVWSELGAGTEVELSIPGSIAYEVSSARTRFRLFRKGTEQGHEHRS